MVVRLCIALAALGGFVSVGVGAFAAHGMGAQMDAQSMQWLETGARYQMYHALAALGAAALTGVLPHRRRVLMAAAALFFAGMILFSGTLYALALTPWTGLGAVAPLGGLSYLAGWLVLVWAALGARAGGKAA
ncbi:MAG: DUF423 domain-containing protein [Rhodovibrionaceae bacterium]|nr:DUF423 domain-containing protein [Rhodovibrionaceae bacterium]